MSFGSFFKHYIAPAISGVLLITGIRWADTTFMVPVTVFTVQKIDVEPDAVFLSGRMYKPAYRANCSFEELIATVDDLPPIRIFRRIDGDAFTRPLDGQPLNAGAFRAAM